MGAEEDFLELSESLNNLAEYFEESASGRAGTNVGRDPETGQFISTDSWEPKRRIANGISKAMRNGIVPDAKHNASRYVTQEAKESIRYEQIKWDQHVLIATHDLVKHHEFGTSTRADDKSRATINAPNRNGYVIPIEGYDSLRFGPDDVELMDELNFQFVVHPGVEGQHFMRDALKENMWLVKESVLDELRDIEVEI